ncbi:MAG: DUF4038 domain-containing protein [Caldilineaceae bacterium]
MQIAQWHCLELTFQSTASYANPLQEVEFSADFSGPTGETQTIRGFWDGGAVWRVRFAPNAVGEWRYETRCADAANDGLHAQSGQFTCTPPTHETRFTQHGPVRLAANKRHLEHADGTPFFWLADTAWNGPLRSTKEEWDHYLQVRTRQRFSAVQWVTTQWRAAPDGDIEGGRAYAGDNSRIEINPAFFQRLDERVAATARAGLLNVPVLLWTLGSAETLHVNPGHSLPEDQAVLLVRYMVARWGAYPVVWILPGDGNYGGEKAERWQRIGRAAFGPEAHAPVALHCCGMHFPAAEFRDEAWLDMLGYQSGHGDSVDTLQWIVSGPPAQEWRNEPRLFYINLEPPYENHVAYQSGRPHNAHSVRRATYWSLLNAPTAGVTYGGHGVWGWDDGSAPPVDHPRSGIPLPWGGALTMPAAEQMAHLVDFFASIRWWELRPAPELLAAQPGAADVHKYVLASRSQSGDLAVVYTPAGGTIVLNAAVLPAQFDAVWVEPRAGQQLPATSTTAGDHILFETPSEQDWILFIQIANS